MWPTHPCGHSHPSHPMPAAQVASVIMIISTWHMLVLQTTASPVSTRGTAAAKTTWVMRVISMPSQCPSNPTVTLQCVDTQCSAGQIITQPCDACVLHASQAGQGCSAAGHVMLMPHTSTANAGQTRRSGVGPPPAARALGQAIPHQHTTRCGRRTNWMALPPLNTTRPLPCHHAHSGRVTPTHATHNRLMMVGLHHYRGMPR
ncbi:hypothetical protein V8C86DRAFT_2763252 [Haematococcus lacustris]